MIKSIKDKQNYPSELIEIYVVRHNCIDRTAELAKKSRRNGNY